MCWEPMSAELVSMKPGEPPKMSTVVTVKSCCQKTVLNTLTKMCDRI